MVTSDPRILVTGANGQLGRLVIDGLLEHVPASQIVAVMRNPVAGNDLASQGVEVRRADYDDPTALDAALAGIDRMLLVSSSAIGQRVPQHRNVIKAAKRAGVSLLAYTSILHADTSPLGLAAEHRATEALLHDAGVPFVLLRNGWYTENYAGTAPVAVARGAVVGSAGMGRIASAARADYAAAAVTVLTSGEEEAGKTYELAGDDSFTLPELAAEIARQSGKPVVYQDLPEQTYKAMLEQMGLPEPLAAAYAQSDVGASKGGLFDQGHQLSALIGRPTTTLAQSVTKALRQ